MPPVPGAVLESRLADLPSSVEAPEPRLVYSAVMVAAIAAGDCWQAGEGQVQRADFSG